MRSQQRIYKSAVTDGTRWAAYNHRPGDIFVCTPPKCGTTWMQTIVASLLWPAGDVPGAVFEVSAFLEANVEAVDLVLARLDAQTHRRFVKTHSRADCIPVFQTGRYIVV